MLFVVAVAVSLLEKCLAGVEEFRVWRPVGMGGGNALMTSPMQVGKQLYSFLRFM